jgi:hypothetical protein
MSKYHFQAASGNKKTGPIPVTMTSSETCPPDCPLIKRGCYAKSAYYMGIHWRKTDRTGKDIDHLTEKIVALPRGQLWRHNQAGDLPGTGRRIHARSLEGIVTANRGKRGFTYTHKPVLGNQPSRLANRAAIASAVSKGFCINLSANNLKEADQLADLNIAPVVAIVPRKYGFTGLTPRGRRVVLCPAQDKDTTVTCARCRLCAQLDRTTIIAFAAHGRDAMHAEKNTQEK